MPARRPIPIALARYLTWGLDRLAVGRLLRRGPLLPQVDGYLGSFGGSTVDRRPREVAPPIRVAAGFSAAITVAAATVGVWLAVSDVRWGAALMFLVTGAAFGTSVLGWLTDDAIGQILRHPWWADLAWWLIVLLFGVALPVPGSG